MGERINDGIPDPEGNQRKLLTRREFLRVVLPVSAAIVATGGVVVALWPRQSGDEFELFRESVKSRHALDIATYMVSDDYILQSIDPVISATRPPSISHYTLHFVDKFDKNIKPFTIGIENFYNYSYPHKATELYQSDLALSGGIFQRAATRAGAESSSESFTPIPKGSLLSVAASLLNITSGTIQISDTRIKYKWGEIDGINFEGQMENGWRYEGYFDASGQGRIKVKDLNILDLPRALQGRRR